MKRLAELYGAFLAGGLAVAAFMYWYTKRVTGDDA